MKVPKLVLVAAISILAVAACGGGGAAPTTQANATSAPGATSASTQETATPPAAVATQAAASQSLAAVGAEMCALLTPADLKTATSASYGAGKADDYGNCAWTTTESGGGVVYASIQASDLPTIKSTFPGGTALTIAGHPAYWLNGGSLDDLWVDVNGRLLSMAISPENEATNQPILKALGEIAVPNLK